ncbi:unnamed protein product [Cunninghamella blakesleeana]
MSTHSQQVTATGFYPSTGYYTDSKPLLTSTTSPSIYMEQPMSLPTSTNAVDPDMAAAVAALSSTTSLPPLSQLLPASKPTSQQQTLISTNNNTNNNNTIMTVTPIVENTNHNNNKSSIVNNHPHNMASSTIGRPDPSTTNYQPSPTVPSHPKIPSNHSDMYYRPPPNDSFYMIQSNVPSTYSNNTNSNDPNNEGNKYNKYNNHKNHNHSSELISTSISPANINIDSNLVFSSNMTPPPAPSSHYSQQQPPRINHHPHQQLPSPPPSSFDHFQQHSHYHQQQQQQQQQNHQKVFSFVSLPGVNQKKRPRRKYHEVERLYHCNYPGCTKSYGTLNHLNAHVCMQDHGPKRHPSEFKELRKMWRKQKRDIQAKKKNINDDNLSIHSASTTNTTTNTNMIQQQMIPPPPPPPSVPSIPSTNHSLIHHNLPPPPPLPTVLYPQPNHWGVSVPPPSHPNIVQHHVAATVTGYPNAINFQ